MNSIGSIGANCSCYNSANERTFSRIKARDTNSDNKLNLNEAKLPQEKFDRVDLNNDEQIGRLELTIAKRHTVNHHMADQLMKNKDSNSDGMLSMDEHGIPEKTFNRVDRNNDGQLGETELVAGRRILVNHHNTFEIIQNNDTDENNLLNNEELKISEENFDKIDRNNDGEIGSTELNAAKRFFLRNNWRESLTEQVMDRKDTDKNGLLSTDELAIKEENFNHIDTNDDNQIDMAELQTLRLRSLPAYNNSQQNTVEADKQIDLST